jgi:hypothetical protein
MDPYHMCKLSVSGAVDESRVSATTALNRRDPVVLGTIRIHELIAEKKKTATFSHARTTLRNI